MAANTKARSEEIQQAARRLLESRKIDLTQQNLDVAIQRDLAQQLASQASCHLNTAKRNIAAAAQYLRGERTATQWGGRRPGAGNPEWVRKGDEEQHDT